MSALVVAKRVKNCILYTNGMMRIDNVRFSYPHVDKAWKKEGDAGDPKFSITGMMAKETHEAAKTLVAEEMKRLLAEAKIALAKDKKFLRDGDANTDEDDAELVNSYAGCWYVNARESRRPKLRDKAGNLLDPVDDLGTIQQLFYGGAWGHVLIRPWVQDNKHGKRLNAGLVGVMFDHDDTPFGQGAIDESDAWGDVAQDSGDDDGDDDEL